MFYVCLIILFLGIFAYHVGYKERGAFVFLFFLSQGFCLLSVDWLEGFPITKYTDFALLYMVYVFMMQSFCRDNRFFSWNPVVYKCIGILVIYLTFEFLFTIAKGRESLNYSVAVYRNYLFLMSFGLFKELAYRQVKGLVSVIAIITIITSVLYILQPVVGTNLLQAGKIDEFGRMRNVPTLVYFFLIYATITLKSFNLKSLFIFGILAVALILTGHRGIMIGFVVVILLYLLVSKNYGKMVQYGLIGMMIALFAGSFLLERFEGKERTSDDLQTVLNMDFRQAAFEGYEASSEGTLSFRVLLLVERFDYLISHPQYLWTGIGMRHEDSPYTERDFKFVLGSANLDKATGLPITQQIDSGDLVWMTPLIKFGILGVLLYVIVSIMMVIYLYKRKQKSIWAMSVFLYYVLLIIVSFKNDQLFGVWELTFIYMIIEMMRKEKKRKTKKISVKHHNLMPAFSKKRV